jgi:hypothetical protein
MIHEVSRIVNNVQIVGKLWDQMKAACSVASPASTNTLCRMGGVWTWNTFFELSSYTIANHGGYS